MGGNPTKSEKSSPGRRGVKSEPSILAASEEDSRKNSTEVGSVKDDRSHVSFDDIKTSEEVKQESDSKTEETKPGENEKEELRQPAELVDSNNDTKGEENVKITNSKSEPAKVVQFEDHNQKVREESKAKRNNANDPGRIKSLSVDMGGVKWSTVENNQKDNRFTITRGWKDGQQREQSLVPFLTGSYQKVNESEAKDVISCTNCKKDFVESKAQKYFCAECEQVFCSNCCSKKKLDKNGNKVWVCNECFWG